MCACVPVVCVDASACATLACACVPCVCALCVYTLPCAPAVARVFAPPPLSSVADWCWECVHAARVSRRTQVYWGDQWLSTAEFTRSSIRPAALANSIPGFRSSFGDKPSFARLHENCLEQQRTLQSERQLKKLTPPVKGNASSSDSSAPEPASGPPLFCGWTKRGFSFERRGNELDGPVEAFRRHALMLATSRAGDRNEFPQVRAAPYTYIPWSTPTPLVWCRSCNARTARADAATPHHMVCILRLTHHALTLRAVRPLHCLHQLWILKPQQSFNQMGISMVYCDAADVASAGAMRDWLLQALPLDGSWTLQEYVKHPLLYRGRKFDMRVWAVITSIDPLRIYLLDHAFPKACATSAPHIPGGTPLIPTHPAPS
jgi:hypothetical protein